MAYNTASGDVSGDALAMGLGSISSIQPNSPVAYLI